MPVDKKAFEEIVKRLKEVNEVVAGLDPAIRSAAFEVLRPYIVGGGGHQEPKEPEGVEATADAEAFFTKHEGEKPSENVLLAATFYYSQYGAVAVGVDDLRAIAAEAGIELPDRPDMTLAQAKRGGKALFRKAGQGRFLPTVHGKTFFKKSYEVTAGKKPAPVPAPAPESQT